MTRFALLAALTFAAAPSVAAQSAGIGVVRLASSHELVHQITGVELRVGGSVVGSPIALRLGFGRLSGDHDRTGSTCSGLVEPGMCPPEPLRDETHFTRGRGELAVALLQSGRSSLGLVGGLVVGRLGSDTEGLTSGKRISADKTVWGADIGGEGRWFFSSVVPVGLEAAFSIGRLNPARNSGIADGYTPFERSFGFTRLRVGVVLELP